MDKPGAGAETRTRFAPSPTGSLHVGNARTALFSWLHARHTGGTFILRLEDTDVARSAPEAERSVIEDLKWLGLEWEEGPDNGGPFGPYRQSERLALYREVAERLRAGGKAYDCYCTDEELEAKRKIALGKGLSPHYDGRCRSLGPGETEDFRAQGRRPSVRFVVEYDEVVVQDVVRGEVRFKRGMVGDFVILRSDGMPTYNFACVVDDWKMKISHVIRGEEHLSNTLRQCLLYRDLGVAPPVFAHLSLVLGPDRSKLSKRHGATSVAELRRLGYPAEAVINHLALLGWSPGDDVEIMSRSEIVERFLLERVSKSPSVFDAERLDWLGAHYIKNMTAGRLVDGVLPYLRERGCDTSDLDLVARAVEANKHRVKRFADLAEEASAYLGSARALAPGLASKLRGPGAAKALDLFIAALEAMAEGDKEAVRAALARVLEESGMKRGEVFMPLRIALTASQKGPEIPAVVEVLGRERALARLRLAREIALS
jgi:nondiscriminating glutamyl-tRNA synthetase